MPHMNVNGVRLYYEVAGEGFPLVLIAGFSADHTIWNSMIPLLSTSYQVITFDNRGCGQSDCPDVPYTVEMMANDTLGLLDALGVVKAHVLGHSMGASIAQYIAATSPERVRKVFLLTPFPMINVAAGYSLAVTLRMLEAGVPFKLIIETRIPWLFSPGFIASQVQVDTFIEKTAAYPYPQPLVGFRRQLEALEAFDSSPLLSRIVAPTFILSGERDIISPPIQAEVLRKGISHVDLLVAPGAAHLLPVEQPEFCVNTIRTFLSRKNE